MEFIHFPRSWINGFLIAGGTGLFMYWLASRLHTSRMRRVYAERRARKQAQNREAKATFAFYLQKNPMESKEITEITSKSFMQLVHSLKNGQLNPSKVLLAYQHKAFEVDKSCNCVIEFLYPKFSDINMDGPFAGVPVSIKDNFTVKGCESYAGMAHYLNGPETKDSVMVTVLKSLGFVPFVRTNVPQAMLSVLSTNPIDGTTLNPIALDRSPAGSSSGEAALVGGGGSCIGFGTDLGGSIRLPAAMCNIVGFKPTPKRLSQKHMFTLGRYMATKSCCGPLTRDMESCVAVMRAVFNSKVHHDADYMNIPLPIPDAFPTNKRLRFGYFTFDGSFVPVPASKRAVLHVKSKLEAIGHEVVPWQPPTIGADWLTLFLTALMIDDGAKLLETLQYDEVEPTMAAGLKIYKTGRIQRLFTLFLAKMFGDPADVPILRALTTIHDVASYIEYRRHLSSFLTSFYDHYQEAGLDALICPAFGLAAPIPIESREKMTGMLSYPNLFNITSMPAGCLPSGVCVERNDMEFLEANMNNLNALLGDGPHSEHMEKFQPYLYKKAIDLQKGTEGLPISVQVAAAPWRDDMCLFAMSEVERAVRS